MGNTVKLIVAYQKDGGIGLGNDLLYTTKELPGDMRKRFMPLRENTVIFTGRPTYIPFRVHPLPNCINCVLSRTEDFEYADTADKIFSDLITGIRWAQETHPHKDIAIIGGEQIYNEALRLGIVDIIHATEIDFQRPADKFFHKPEEFSKLIFDEPQVPSQAGIPFSFKDWVHADYQNFVDGEESGY